ncbi:MCE family protein [Williamsia sterculiae]|nr:MCE family protein [Williamsia sterculiae]
MVAMMVAVIAVAAFQFLGAFRSTVPVTLTADRAGLVMGPDAKVRLRGVVVGRVESVTAINRAGHPQVRLALNMDSGQLARIPANVTAFIRSNTVFGAKAVDLMVPGTPSAQSLRAGATIGADRVVVELNTLYQRLVDVLAAVHPDQLNATLGAVDSALRGRGEQIGQGLSDLSAVLQKTNPHLDALDADIEAGATVANTYADAAPDLLRAVDNLTVVGNTLRDNASDLDALLVNVTGLSNTVNGIIGPKKDTIIAALTDLNPTARLLGYQAPGLGCFLRATASASNKAAGVFGLQSGSLQLNAGVLPGKEPYRYPDDLPRNNVDGPPTCEAGLSDPSSTEHVPFYVGDDAAAPYQPRTTPKANPQKLFQLMFGGPSSG